MHLVDHAHEVLRLATTLPGGGADAAAVRVKCEAALADFAASAARAGCAVDGVDAARFALVALIDERVMAPGSPLRLAWLDQPLQLTMFACASAGEEFYRRLERWRRPRRAEEADVLEVFQICLALGFRGMMVGDAAESARRLLAEQTAGEVLAVRPIPEHGLSPRWQPQPQQSGGQDAGGTRAAWLVPAAALAAVLLVWLAGWLWVGAAAEGVLAELR
jgi:type IV/VI secretion system ImpK/VasF family protein